MFQNYFEIAVRHLMKQKAKICVLASVVYINSDESFFHRFLTHRITHQQIVHK